jgi:cell division protease FtsH
LGRDVSEATAQKIDDEVKRLVQAGYDDAKRILTENMDGLHRLAKTLLELETLSGDEIAKILNGEEIVRDEETGVAIELSSNSAVPETEATSENAPTLVPVVA